MKLRILFVGLIGGMMALAADNHSLAVVTPIVQLNPAVLDFATAPVGSLTAAQTVNISNNGADPLTITQIALGGSNPGDFVLSAPATPITLSATQSIAVSVRFDPTAGGSRSATLLVTDNGFHSPQTVSLAGAGNANAELAVSLGAVQTGSRTLTYTATVKNAGPALATNVLLSSDVPQGTKFDTATASQGSCVTPAPGAIGALNCAFGNLPSGAQATLTFVADVITTGKATITTNASVSASSPDPVGDDNSVTLVTRWGGPK